MNTAGWSDWGANCEGTTKAPPVPGAPSISSSKNNNTRTISWSWTKPSNTGIYQYQGAFSGTGTYQSKTLTSQPFGVQRCERVRGAYNSRLASWGYWGPYSGYSCQTLVSPTTPWAGSAPGCPIPTNWYVYQGSPWSWNVRRASASTCELRTVVTSAGATLEQPAGTQLSLYRIGASSGAPGWSVVWSFQKPPLTAGATW